MLFILLKKIQKNLIDLTWPFLTSLFLLNGLFSWFLFYLAGEEIAHNLTDWVYFHNVTATTVGYGDFSPSTVAGKWIAALWFIPTSIGLFAAFIGKTTTSIANIWREKMKGSGNFSDLTGHTLILGWHGELTEKMVNILYMDSKISGDIVLCVIKEMDNPMPDKIRFVRGESFTQPELLKRAGIQGADRIIIYAESDEQCVTTAVSVSSMAPKGHIVAYCETGETANMLKRVVPNIECIQSNAIETLVRSAQDPGVSRVIHELLSIDQGPTQFTAQIPDGYPPRRYGDLLSCLHSKHNVTLMGIIDETGGIHLNVSADFEVNDQHGLIYMANTRMSEELIIQCFC
jgi:voltage-gated potassium channel